jgi:hypothetical protein
LPRSSFGVSRSSPSNQRCKARFSDVPGRLAAPPGIAVSLVNYRALLKASPHRRKTSWSCSPLLEMPRQWLSGPQEFFGVSPPRRRLSASKPVGSGITETAGSYRPSRRYDWAAVRAERFCQNGCFAGEVPFGAQDHWNRVMQTSRSKCAAQ